MVGADESTELWRHPESVKILVVFFLPNCELHIVQRYGRNSVRYYVDSLEHQVGPTPLFTLPGGFIVKTVYNVNRWYLGIVSLGETMTRK